MLLGVLERENSTTLTAGVKQFNFAYCRASKRLAVSFICQHQVLAEFSHRINPIHTGGGGGGGVSTSRPVNCSELQNEISHNLETW